MGREGGVPEQALRWFPVQVGLGLVVEDEPFEVSCISCGLLVYTSLVYELLLTILWIALAVTVYMYCAKCVCS